MHADTIHHAEVFDAAAARYDTAFSALPAVQTLRKRIFGLLLPRLPARARVLDLGCGTGEDILALADMGHFAVGCDPSAGMLDAAAGKIRGGSAKAVFLRARNLRHIRDDSFDMVLSNFGAFNCMEDPENAIEECHRILHAGGALVVVLIGKYCLWETLAFLVRGRFRAAFRRWRRGAVVAPVDGTDVTIRLFSHREFRMLVTGPFEVLSVAGLNVFTPPPGSTRVRGLAGGLWRRLERVEEILQKVPPLRSLGDHIIFVMRKRHSTGRSNGVESQRIS